MTNDTRYVPALRHDALTALYDPLVALTTREHAFRGRLIQQANLAPDQSILDLACGTGTLAIWVKLCMPSASVSGVDGDPKILTRAMRKARGSGVDIAFAWGFATQLPYAAASYDRVLSSLFFHHLSHSDKKRAIQEVLRILKPGGEFHVADWGRPHNALMRALFLIVRALDGFENTRDNVTGNLPSLFVEGGFEGVTIRHELPTMLGTMTLYSMRKPQE